MLIHGAKDWPDTSRRESTGWAGGGFSTCEVVRLAGETVGALPNLNVHLGGAYLCFFKSSSPGMACWGETQLFYLPPGSTKDWQRK